MGQKVPGVSALKSPEGDTSDLSQADLCRPPGLGPRSQCFRWFTPSSYHTSGRVMLAISGVCLQFFRRIRYWTFRELLRTMS